MLAEYTPISHLTPEELAALKALTDDMKTESMGSHFNFRGKIIAISELTQYKKAWEHERSSKPGQLLLG